MTYRFHHGFLFAFAFASASRLLLLRILVFFLEILRMIGQLLTRNRQLDKQSLPRLWSRSTLESSNLRTRHGEFDHQALSSLWSCCCFVDIALSFLTIYPREIGQQLIQPNLPRIQRYHLAPGPSLS